MAMCREGRKVALYGAILSRRGKWLCFFVIQCHLGAFFCCFLVEDLLTVPICVFSRP